MSERGINNNIIISKIDELNLPSIADPRVGREQRQDPVTYAKNAENAETT
jgi:hypothetical protein